MSDYEIEIRGNPDNAENLLIYNALTKISDQSDKSRWAFKVLHDGDKITIQAVSDYFNDKSEYNRRHAVLRLLCSLPDSLYARINLIAMTQAELNTFLKAKEFQDTFDNADTVNIVSLRTGPAVLMAKGPGYEIHKVAGEDKCRVKYRCDDAWRTALGTYDFADAEAYAIMLTTDL